MGFAKLMGNAIMITRQELGWLLIGGVIFFTLSWLLFKQVPPSKNHRDIDSGAYVQAANFLLQDHSFSRIHFQPYYGLGYPFLLAGMKKIGNESVGVIVAIQALLAWFIALLAWCITSRLFNRRTAWIAYIIAITDIGLLTFSQFLLTEVLLTLLLTIAVERMFFFLAEKKHHALLTAGFFFGLSCPVKAVAAVFCIALLPFIFCVAQRRKRIRTMGCFFIAFMLPYLGYQAYTWQTFTQKGCSMVTINACYWYYPHLLAHINNTNSDHEREQLRRYPSHKEVWLDLRRDVIQYPKEALTALVKNWIKTLCGLYTTNLKVLIAPEANPGGLSFFRLSGTFFERCHAYITGNTSLTWIKTLGYWEAALLIINYFFLILGLLALCTQHRWATLIFAILYLTYFVGITGHDGCARFRMMFDMLLIALAAGGIELVLTGARKEKS